MTTHPLILALGEILWDLLPAGKQLGGAPANFAYHAAQLGADTRTLSAVGDDPPGREIIARLRVSLADKIRQADLQSLEHLGRSQLYSVMNSDTLAALVPVLMATMETVPSAGFVYAEM